MGGPAQNDHTIDAGWYGVAPYEVLKTVAGPAPPDTTYTVVVESAVNFRGQDRLGQSGQDPGGRDPQVTTTSFELTPGEPAASAQDLPYGYTLTFSEDGRCPTVRSPSRRPCRTRHRRKVASSSRRRPTAR